MLKTDNLQDPMCEFDDIRSYHDKEVTSTIQRLLKDLNFQRIVTAILPNKSWKEIRNQLESFRTISEFQYELIIKTIDELTDKTASGISHLGIENIQNNLPYTFISNHRDIILDASILCSILVKEGLKIAEIAIGDNLLILPCIEDVVRLNKSFIVKRSPDFHERVKTATHLSKYIHSVIMKKESVWIAQREGRAKDSNDQTQESILKMLTMNPNFSFEENIWNLNIVPLAISYEYDPCDFLKAKEFHQKRENPGFKKSRKDDFESMERGLFGYKGKIHFQFGKLINSLLKTTEKKTSKPEFILECCHWIDTEIFLNYRFFPINYIAYDRLWNQTRFREKYTDNDLKIFHAYLNQQLGKIDLKNKDIPFLTKKILEIYACPLKNHLEAKEE